MPQLETEVIIRNGRVVGGSSSGVTDVQVNGTSVVNNGVAEIDLSGKQDTLTAGNNIQIAQDGTISATDTTYTAGTGINIDANNIISASGGGTITDVQVDGVSVVTSGVAEIDLTGKADAATTLSGYGITDANINNGTITLGSNTITPLTSHQDISGKVNKAGDTMTGSLTISNSSLGSCILKDNSYTINTSSNNGVSSFSGNNFEMQDSASTISTKFGNYLSSDGSVEAIISAHNKKTNGTATSNSLEIKIAKDGTKSYAVSDPAAFRSAIDAVSKAGDTMTGALTMAGKDIYLKTTGSSSDDSGDIVWYYGNGQEKARLWTNDAYTAESGLNFRIYKKDGTSLFSGTIPLRNTNTTYSAGTGISLSGTTFSNSGVRSISTGSSNGTISVNTNGTSANVSVKGLGSAAYSNTSAFAAASHSHSNYQTTLSSTSANTGGGGTAVRKYGNVCWMPLFGCAANKVGTIPSGYRPGVTARAIGLCIVSSKVYYCVLEVNTGGAFKVWYYSTYPGSGGTEIQSTSNALYGEMIWIT